MIVCSLPRCGATKYCLDLEKELNIPFVGELNPIHIGNSNKETHHETKFQPNLTPARFAEILENRDKYIVMVNMASYMYIPTCDKIILRKNMRNAALSYANLLIKIHGDAIHPIGILHQLFLMNNDYIGITSYLAEYPKEVVWYEDYYGNLKTVTPFLDEYKYKHMIIKEIDKYYGEI